ncbi:P-loop NTPase fold protein [Nocardia sp. NPDC057663]|uniref:P-loop NTPase fold protein n=1 Tax=Nocardia sp. NPDC057663 TaxID=3346201 RepID=UPI003670112A
MASSGSEAARWDGADDAARRFEESGPFRDEIERSRSDSETGIVGDRDDIEARADRLLSSGAVPASVVIQLAASDVASTLPSLERVIAASDNTSAAWVSRAARAAQCVARLSLRRMGREVPIGTGILVTRQLLLTNWHVLPDKDTARDVVVEFDAEEGPDSVPKPTRRFLLNPDSFMVSDRHLDTSLVLLHPDNEGEFPGDRFGRQLLVPIRGSVLVGENLNLIGHPYGRLKELWTRGNRLVFVLDQFVQYYTDQGVANSGSPIFNDQWEMVALHHAGVPRRDEAGHVLRRDGTPWREGDDDDQIDWVACEGIRADAIVSWLDTITPSLPESARVLLSELSSATDSGGVTAPAPSPHAAGDWFAALADSNPLVGQLIEEAQHRPEDFRDADSVQNRMIDLVANRYSELDPQTAQLFRRAALIDTEGLDAGIAARLTDSDRTEASRMLDLLAGQGLMVERPDGRVYFTDEPVQRFAATELANREEEEARLALQQEVHRWLSGRDHLPEPRLARDFWTTEDELEHAPYANAIASFIQHESTQPPLTIGVKAPWGAGKTSLMRMVQKRLDPGVGEDPFGTSPPGARTPRPIQLDPTSRAVLMERPFPDRQRSWFRPWRRETAAQTEPVSVREALLQAEEPLGAAERIPLLRAEQRGQTSGLDPKDWRATVWFNPWMYQSGEQIWSGLAHEIITQITARLPVGDRERFWLKLNLARMDRGAVRRRVYRTILERLLPVALGVAAGIVVACVAVLLAKISGSSIPLGPTTSGIVAIATSVGVVGSVIRTYGFFGQAAAGPLGGLVQGPAAGGVGRIAGEELKGTLDLFPEPGYGPKSGLLYLVHMDMKRVLDLVATGDRPLVVFVDDLDRCTPGTVVQVIEAVNLFLAGEFPNCVFVIAMEPRVVAAHIEVAYSDLNTALQVGHARGDWASLGWRFLEKIIQLPLSLPAPQGSGGIGNYARGLLQANRPSPPTAAAAFASDHQPEPRRREDADVGANARIHAQQSREPSADAAERDRPGMLDLDLVRRMTAEIRRRTPSPTTLPEAARATQQLLIPNAPTDPLRPETIAAVEAVLKDLYRDADAADAIAAALPSLAATTPREIKRYINLFRFYTFVAQRQRLDGRMAPSAEQIAKLAALAIRWPHLVSLLGPSSNDVEHPLEVLEQASRDDTRSWGQVLAVAGLIALPAETDLPMWCTDLRNFLAAGPRIGTLAARLL